MKPTILLALMMAYATSVHADTIPLKQDGDTFLVPVLVNGKITLDFTIDSGASDVSIPADVFSTLTRAGTILPSDLLDKAEYQLADGSKQESQRFRIRSLRIGSFEVRDVIGSVAPPSASLLMGQSLLSRLNSWSIDNQRKVLLINETAGSVVGSSSHGPESAKSVSKWTLLGRETLGGAIGPLLYVDVSSIHVNGSRRWAWFKAVSTIHRKDGKPSSRELTRYGFDCDDNTMRLEAETTYKPDGFADTIPSSSLPYEWEAAIPESTGAAEMQFVCGWKRK